MQTSHQIALEAKHASLDRRLHEEAARPHPDPVTIGTLKKQKLRVKEEIENL